MAFDVMVSAATRWTRAGEKVEEVTKLGFIGTDQTDILLLYREEIWEQEVHWASVIWAIHSPQWLINILDWYQAKRLAAGKWFCKNIFRSHKIMVSGHATPDTGWDDWWCTRCGEGGRHYYY